MGERVSGGRGRRVWVMVLNVAVGLERAGVGGEGGWFSLGSYIK